MKNKIITTVFILGIFGLQGCTQIIGAAVSTTATIAAVPVKMSAAAASAATNTVIDRVLGK
jgi:hypothetical protein